MKRSLCLFMIIIQLLPAGVLSAAAEGLPSIPRSQVTQLAPTGYMARRVNGFLNTWVPVSVKENPELIQAVLRANPKYAGMMPNLYSGLLMDQNTYFGQHLAGLAVCYRLNRDEMILQVGNDLVAALDKARGENGYLGVHAGNNRLGTGNNWDVWGHYNAIWGLHEWYRLTGNETALDMALDAADYCIRHFETHTYDTAVGCIRCSLGHAYALLYQETGKDTYLKEALRILEDVWPGNGNWLENAAKGMQFYQSSQPRWESLHAIMLIHTLYEITGDQQYYDAIDQIWWSIIKTDRHNNGGFTTKEIAVGNPYRSGAIETCANIAWMVFSTDYLRYSRDSYVADEIELTYYNAVLGAITENMRHVTYDNPMEGQILPSQTSLAWIYNTGCPDYNCCQGYACRGMGQVVEWASMTDEGALYLNFYGPCTLQTKTPGGQEITLRITGDYPVSGDIGIEIDGLQQPEAFDLMLRIPVWSDQTALSLNGAADLQPAAGKYFALEKCWENGDQLSLNLDMSLHYWRGGSTFRKRTSLYWGPILLTQDEYYTDLPTDEVNFTLDAVKNAAARPGDGVQQWLIVEAESDEGALIPLIDYASAGKQENSHFTTWLRISPAPEAAAFSREGMPLWAQALPE